MCAGRAGRGSISTRQVSTISPGLSCRGLSANALAVEPWWGDRPARLWVARRLYDYRHLGCEQDVAPWLLVGDEVARGPDNEPVVRCKGALARIGEAAVAAAVRAVEQFSGDWGPLERVSGRGAADGHAARGRRRQE